MSGRPTPRLRRVSEAADHPDAPAEATAGESEPETDLPEPMVRLLGDYERHLVSERDLAPHTVRAYLGDITGLLDHCRAGWAPPT